MTANGKTMQVWHFSEMAYHPAWPQLEDTYRVTIPSRLFDPKIGADLYHRYLDEWALCDELGINIMTNEHHATATCADSVCTIPMAILARETKKVRLLALGMPIGNRNDPIRIAEEYSMIDVISRGRLDMGFVKGVPFEISPANTNPADLVDRFWEAHDLILKAMSSHDGPFNWEGTHFQYRSVNVWPRPYQQPHPPVWTPVGSEGSAREAAARGITIGVLNTGWVRTPGIFEAYRKSAHDAGRESSPDKLAYMALIGVGDTREEGYRRADQILGYSRTSGIVSPQFMNPAGYVSPEISAQMLKAGGAAGARATRIQTKDGRPINPRTMTVEDAIDAGLVFAGTPDDVFEQIKSFHAHVGGFGHLLMMGQGGTISHEDTVANLTMFSREVLPRLAELG
jgi:alkanesulfonate monooxygenase SsuD/methylene tetrahydromethanopterin reductase-like flavin-dependent oxidoreductase (luciferase family)